MAFLADPQDGGGWVIAIEPQSGSNDESCRDFSGVVALPLHGEKATDLSLGYGYTAREEVGYPPREFPFVLNEADWKREWEWGKRLRWSYSCPEKEVEEAQERFGSLASGKTRFRILDSKVSTGGYIVDVEDLGKIDWVKFQVEITFPPGR